MRKKVLWGLVVAALVVVPAVVGLLVVNGDDARTQGALVQEGGPESIQLVIQGVTPAGQAIAVESYSWGVENATTIGSATGGAGAGKAKFGTVEITKQIDEMSPLLFKQLANGLNAPTATITLRKASADGKATPYATYTLKTVFITNVDHSGSSGDVPAESIKIVYGSVTLESSGTGADKAGAAKANKYGWNQVTNKAETP